ncbi:Endonuclease/exonuclease/phosphatase [Powellomyces hirtus]|nr:Endonuclease/exonuclease/phosphatase [Powellomyces hirtus]
MLDVLRGLLSPGRADDSFFVPKRSYDDYDYVRSEWIADPEQPITLQLTAVALVTALTFLWLLTLIARQVATFVEHQALRRASEDPDREPLMRDRQTAERAGQWAPRFDRASDALRHALMMLLAAIVFVSIPLPYACKVDQPLQPGIPISPGPHCMTCLGNGTTLGTSIISWVFFALAGLWLVLELVVADATSAALARTFVGLASFPLILAIFVVGFKEWAKIGEREVQLGNPHVGSPRRAGFKVANYSSFKREKKDKQGVNGKDGCIFTASGLLLHNIHPSALTLDVHTTTKTDHTDCLNVKELTAQKEKKEEEREKRCNTPLNGRTEEGKKEGRKQKGKLLAGFLPRASPLHAPEKVSRHRDSLNHSIPLKMDSHRQSRNRHDGPRGRSRSQHNRGRQESPEPFNDRSGRGSSYRASRSSTDSSTWNASRSLSISCSFTRPGRTGLRTVEYRETRQRNEAVRRTTASHIRYSTISTDEEYSLPDNRAPKTRRRESSTDSKASRARSRSRSPSRRWDERHQCYVSTSSRSVPRSASPRRSSSKTEFVPLDREWLPGPESKRIEDSGSKHKFTVMTYNCLAPSLVGSNAYLYRSSQKAHGRSIVEFSTRGPMLIADIVARASDIVCLQEVDDRYFSSFFEPQLAAHGYTGTFLRCTGTKTDGSAILVKSEVFDIVELKHVQFKPYKHNVAVVMILRSKELGRLICVATTHILWSPKAGEIKMAQLLDLMRHARDMVEKQEAHTNCTIPFVFTGDLNINPGSFLHEFIVTGEADMANVDARYMSGQLFRKNWSGLMPLVTFQPSSSTSLYSTSYVSMDMDDDTPAPSSVPPDLAPKETPPPESWFGTTWCSLPARAFGLNANSRGTTPQPSSQIARHPFNFTSVYAPYFDALTNEPYFTTWHDQVHELVDYIFYGHLKPEARTKTPSLTVDSPKTHTHIECVRYLKPPAVKETARMPNPRCPSDHVYLLAEFVVRT